jgi:hypothetical protein
VKSIDLHNYFRAWALIIVGLIALVISPFEGSLEAAGLGALSLLAGCGMLAWSVWDRRNPVAPAPIRLRRRRGSPSD